MKADRKETKINKLEIKLPDGIFGHIQQYGEGMFIKLLLFCFSLIIINPTVRMVDGSPAVWRPGFFSFSFLFPSFIIFWLNGDY